MENGKQHTVTWHVDDVKSNHVDKKGNDNFYKSCKKAYGNIGEVKVTCRKIHDYLIMILDYSKEVNLALYMIYYIVAKTNNFAYELSGVATGPWIKICSKSIVLQRN